jgi:hypothetical protein
MLHRGYRVSAIYVWCSPLCSRGSHSVGAATVTDIIGTRHALQCYYTNLEVRCRDLKTGEDWKVFERAASTRQLWQGSINADGTKLVCEDGRMVCVIDLDGSNRSEVTGLQTANGRFWRDSLGNDWVVYSGEEEIFRQAGSTWMVRIDAATNAALDSTRTLLAGEQYSCGRNASGEFLGEVYANSYILNLRTGVKSTVLYDTTRWYEPPCTYGSLYPGAKPWLMFSVDTTLAAIVISQWLPANNTARIVWRYDSPSTRAWAQWSVTDPGVCAIVKGTQLLLAAITADTSGTTHNQGSHVEAAAGITFTAGSGGIIGGPWVGERTLRAGTPLISPAGGLVAQDTIMVSMVSVTDSAALHYTVDGSTPTTASALYSAPFALTIPDTGGVVLTARAFKTGMSESPVAQANFRRLPLRDSTAASPVEPGLSFEYYEGLFLSPDDINQPWAQPCLRGGIDSFSIGMRERDDHFAVRYTGYFRAATDGKYTFFITSDDSSELYIGTERIVATNYKLGARSGIVGLKTGLHPVMVVYHQGDGGKELTVEYSGPSVTRRTVPRSVLFRDRSPIRITAPTSHDTLAVGSNLTVKWQADTSVRAVHVDIAVNPPAAWTPLTATAIDAQSAAWGRYTWKVPAEFASASLHNARIAFRVRSSTDSTVAATTRHRILIIDPSPVRWQADHGHRRVVLRDARRDLIVSLSANAPHRVELVAANGRVMVRWAGSGAAQYVIAKNALPAGVYMLRVVSAAGAQSRPVVISR